MRFPPLPFRRNRRIRPRRRRYAAGDVRSDAGNLFVFAGVFLFIAFVGGYVMGVPVFHHALPHVDPATLQGMLPSPRDLLHR